MKRSITVICLFIAFCSLQAQIKVSTSNNVGIGTSSPLSKLSVNTDGYTNYIASFQNSGVDRVGRFTLDTPTNTNYNIALLANVSNISSGYKNVAGYFSSYSSSPHTKRSFGVRAAAGNGVSGYNYGVMGLLVGDSGGAGIVGAVDTEPAVPSGQFAGYFYGNVRISDNLYVDDELWVSGVEITSDINLKTDVQSLKSNGGQRQNLNRLLSMNPISYKLKAPEIDLQVYDTTEIPRQDLFSLPEYNTDTTKVHFGLSAQELQQILPELVSEHKDGYLAVNYIGLIPILIEGMREQQTIIEELQSELTTLQAEMESLQKAGTE